VPGATTTFDEFTALLPGRRVVPVTRELFADGETPVGIYRKLAGGRPGTFLLESAEQGGIWSRYSFVGASSYGVLTEREGRVEWQDYGLPAERALGDAVELPPLAALEAMFERWRTEDVPGAPPLTGGLVGFIGWEAIREIEHLPNRPPADFRMPGQAFSFVSELVVIDHRTGTVQLVASMLNDGTEASDELWGAAQHRLDRMQRALARPSEAWLAEIDLTTPAAPRHRTEKDDFIAAVERSKEYIREGDIFQVVISQRFEQETTADPIDVYRVLRSLNPSPYMYVLHLDDPAG
jgi:anthranilate synthase component 1